MIRRTAASCARRSAVPTSGLVVVVAPGTTSKTVRTADRRSGLPGS